MSNKYLLRKIPNDTEVKVYYNPYITGKYLKVEEFYKGYFKNGLLDFAVGRYGMYGASVFLGRVTGELFIKLTDTGIKIPYDTDFGTAYLYFKKLKANDLYVCGKNEMIVTAEQFKELRKKTYSYGVVRRNLRRLKYLKRKASGAVNAESN